MVKKKFQGTTLGDILGRRGHGALRESVKQAQKKVERIERKRAKDNAIARKKEIADRKEKARQRRKPIVTDKLRKHKEGY